MAKVYHVYRNRQGAITNEWIATFAVEDDAFEYGKEFIEGDHTLYVVEAAEAEPPRRK